MKSTGIFDSQDKGESIGVDISTYEEIVPEKKIIKSLNESNQDETQIIFEDSYIDEIIEVPIERPIYRPLPLKKIAFNYEDPIPQSVPQFKFVEIPRVEKIEKTVEIELIRKEDCFQVNNQLIKEEINYTLDRVTNQKLILLKESF